MNHERLARVLIVSLGFTLALAVPAGDPTPESSTTASGTEAVAAPPRTDNAVLEEFLKKVVGDYEGQTGEWRFEYDGVEMLLLADEEFDRIRIVAPVADASQLEKPDLVNILEANFDRAIDAKYAIFNGGVWSTYVHPLGSLSKDQLISAVRQVAMLRHTYGTTYSSMDVIFGGDATPRP
jgi:hypothetical protein